MNDQKHSTKELFQIEMNFTNDILFLFKQCTKPNIININSKTVSSEELEKIFNCINNNKLIFEIFSNNHPSK